MEEKKRQKEVEEAARYTFIFGVFGVVLVYFCILVPLFVSKKFEVRRK